MSSRVASGQLGATAIVKHFRDSSLSMPLPLALNRRSFLFVIFDDHQLFFHGGNFQMTRAKKWVLMSAHHISVTFSSLLKLWWIRDANVIHIFFAQSHNHYIFIIMSWNLFRQNFVVNLWFTFPSHFDHQCQENVLVNILWRKCDAEVNATRNMLNHKSTLLL